MNFLIDLLGLKILLNFLRGLWKLLNDIWKALWDFLNPPRAFSWQTLLLLSGFSYLMGYLATEPLQDILADLGWVFLIFGISWATTDYPLKVYGFSLGPWITGALVCTFIFGGWKGDLTPATLICWPPISAVLASVREFFEVGPKFKTPSPVARQNVVILLLGNLLISCWFQFYFTTQDWLDQYPTLLADDFSKSAFVVKLETPPLTLSRGTVILNSLENSIKRELSNKPWPQVERWLLPQERKARMDALKQQVEKQLPGVEDKWWLFNYKVSSTKLGYKLQVQAIWNGPRSSSGEYSLNKSCLITPTYRQSRGTNSSTPMSKVSCQNENSNIITK